MSPQAGTLTRARSALRSGDFRKLLLIRLTGQGGDGVFQAALVASVVTERPSIVRPLLTAYTISAAVTAVIGLVEFVQGTLVAEDRVAAIQGQDPAHYAALLLPALVFSAYELVHGRQIFLFAPIAFLCTAGIAQRLK